MGQISFYLHSGHLGMLSHFTCVRLSTTLWTVAHQAPLSKASAGKNTGVGSHGLLQGIFLTQGLNPHLLDLPALAGGFFTTTATLEGPRHLGRVKNTDAGASSLLVR